MPESMSFATNFLMVDQLIKINYTLEQIVMQPDWTSYLNNLSGGSDDWKRSAIEACKIKANGNEE